VRQAVTASHLSDRILIVVPSPTPLVVLLAGPNGAGKSTSAARLLKGALAVNEFVNVDTIAQGLSAYRPETAAVAAGRVMLARLRFLAAARRDFAFETTLAGLGHGQWLRQLHASGYRSHLVFLALPSAALAVARVAERARQGGHNVPDPVVRRRYTAGLRNLFASYIPAVDGWQVYDNSDLAGPRLIASGGTGRSTVITDPGAWKRLEEHVA
jgi:predicted ABC-type ATPase